ncbi:iron-containing alcohol dehydrogenase family protein [Paenibacillus bovis]|uniref:Alcohol dehydrogenase iron-type/glycerol dehydrogenase GldA domain-containing protein n=1 Tax=Paenibacillus bovis TaxID=1616788 RepID=A0A172ZHI1_9BACL|nr:iron-containing alcohol dehydrogenase family protein [Paenibacillus bovis]ANF96862.1 hypothetical protein AR543_13145 [Paenibacillus bovis]
MITVKAPSVYLNESNLLAASGSHIRALGSSALIIGGYTALEKVTPALLPALDEAGVSYHLQPFQGQCTREEIQAYAGIARKVQVQLIIGAGGGKVLDLAKGVAEQAGLPVVTIPTIPATCAAWSALTVLYNERGNAAGYWPLRRSPDLVLTDTALLAAAPARYLAAGIGDTLVKWHEFAVNLNGNYSSLALRSSVATARLALEILEEHALDVYEQAPLQQVTPAFIQVTDAIIVLAGLVGSIQDGSVHAAIAHGLHDSLTRLEDTHRSLHGEKVAFGLLTQWQLEQKEYKELHRLASLLHQLDLPVTLRQLGIESEREQAARQIAEGLTLREGAERHLAFAVHIDAVTRAILEADELGTQLIASTADRQQKLSGSVIVR